MPAELSWNAEIVRDGGPVVHWHGIGSPFDYHLHGIGSAFAWHLYCIALYLFCIALYLFC